MEQYKGKIKVWAITNGYRPVEWGNEHVMVYATKKSAIKAKTALKGCPDYKIVPMFLIP